MTKEEIATLIELHTKQLIEEMKANNEARRGEHRGSATSIKRDCLVIRNLCLKLSKKLQNKHIKLKGDLKWVKI